MRYCQSNQNRQCSHNNPLRRACRRVCLVLACFLLLITTASAAITITGMRLSASPEKTRLVFDLSGRLPDYQLQRSRDNQTVILLLPNTQFLAAPKHGIFARSFINDLRIGNSPARALQLILTLRDDHRLRVFTLPQRGAYGDRLVVDVLSEKNVRGSQVRESLINAPQITEPEIRERPVVHALPKIINVVPRQVAALTTQQATPRSQPKKTAQAAQTAQPVITHPTIHPLTQPITQAVISHHPLSLRPIIVVIDPGHGGKDPGAAGKFHAREKHIVLAIAKKLYSRINKIPGMQAQLTRRQDYYIPLRKRLQIARRDKADFFVSIHADAYPDPRAHGASVYALSPHGASSEAARWLAQRENYSELGNINLADKNPMLTSVLLDLSQTATNHASVVMASNILARLHRITRLHRPRVEQAPFMVLKSPDIPSLLVETGFISNSVDEHALTNGAYQNKLADAIAAGIRDYFNAHPIQNTVDAENTATQENHSA